MTELHLVILYGYLIFVNLYAFLICRYDKSAAGRNRRRVPESTLLLTAALGGSLGFYIAMQLFRHKTKHLRFIVLIPMFLIAHLIMFYIYGKI